MNEKNLLKIFVIFFSILSACVAVISITTQKFSNRKAQSVLMQFQQSYGETISHLFKSDILNGNNRSVIDNLERLVNSSAIDGYIFISRVSNFSRSNFSGDLSSYVQSRSEVRYSDSSTTAAEIIVMTNVSRFNTSQTEIVAASATGWIVTFIVLMTMSLLGFVLLKRENAKIRLFINDYLMGEQLTASSELSAVWSPIVNVLMNSKERVDSLNAELESAKISNAIAQTTQMLAHDVRRPFNLFRMAIERIKPAQNMEQVRAIVAQSLPEVEMSLARVNGLISDVLNIGRDSAPDMEDLRLASIVDEVVDETRKLYSQRVLDFRIDVPLDIWIRADFTRLPRVFLNILSNAIEAVKDPLVKIWLNAQSLADGFVQIRIRNEGSYITPEVRERLFELFFTKGKIGGTGLGLAIVKKIVTQHGGTVYCVSQKDPQHDSGFVEIVFTLKVGRAIVEEPSGSASSNVGASSLVLKPLRGSNRPHVVFLDDSPLARWAWENKLKSSVSIQCFEGPKAFFQSLDRDSDNLFAVRNIHTIITDHFFSPDERMTGIEFARALRGRGFAGRILLASSGEFNARELEGVVDKIVDKLPVEWDDL